MKKVKYLSMMVAVVALCAVFTIPVSANSYAYTCNSTDSVNYVDQASGSYYLEVLYDYGTWVPTDNARIRGTVGAETFKAREVIYQLNDGSTNTGVVTNDSFSAIGSGVKTDSWGAELGNDYATGYVIARVYNGCNFTAGHPCTYGQTVAHSSQLTVNQ